MHIYLQIFPQPTSTPRPLRVFPDPPVGRSTHLGNHLSKTFLCTSGKFNYSLVITTAGYEIIQSKTRYVYNEFSRSLCQTRTHAHIYHSFTIRVKIRIKYAVYWIVVYEINYKDEINTNIKKTVI